MKISAKTIAIGISTLIVVGGSVAYYFLTNDNPETLGWMNSSWLYRKSIAVANSGSTLINEDVLIEIDTAALVTAGKLQADCDDLRFTDSDESTAIAYWIEGGCNSTTTQIWVRIPSLTAGGKTIYMYYANSSATNSEETWSSGAFTMLNNNSCVDGWTRRSDLDDKFPYGATTSGTTGGSSSHGHGAYSGSTSGYAGIFQTISGATSVSSNYHSHSGVSITVNTNASVLPAYRDMVFCSKSKLEITPGLIAIFESTPTGWTRVTSLDSVIPRGASSYGGTGGSDSHTHTTTGDTTTGPSGTASAGGTGCSAGSSGHTHTISAASTGSGDNLPPYLSVIFASADDDTYGLDGMVTIVNTVPPLGWTQFSALDSKYPRGASSYGATGGTETHTHSYSQGTGSGSTSSVQCSGTGTYVGNGAGHNFNFTTGTYSNHPPYLTVVYAERKTSQTATPGAEEAGNTAPNAPSSLLTEGQTNPSRVSDSTPEFSAIFSDTDTLDTGDDYQIQVNTASDFTGTSMWDSTKTALSPVVTNGSRSQDISYAGSALSEGTTYYWRMKFWDDSDIESSWSSTANFTMNTTPTAPTSLLTGAFQMAGPPFAPTGLLTDGLTNPTRILSATPSFSAIYTDPDADNASAYQIEVNTNDTFTGTVMWDSTKTSTSVTNNTRSSNYTYAGTTLTNTNTTYYWRIKFWDTKDYEGEWSATAQFSSLQASFSIEGLKLEGLKLD